MSQAEKMQLRMLAIFQQMNGNVAQSQNAWGDLANTMNQSSNQLRRLQNGFKNLGMMIGKLFLPMVQATLPVLNAFIIVLQRMTQAIADFFHISLDGASDKSATSEILEELVEDSDEATESLGKFNKQLAKFDNLNNLTSSSGIDVKSYVGAIDLSKEIEDAVSKYEEEWNKAFDNIEDRSTKIANTISSWFSFSIEPFANGFKEAFDIETLTRFKENLSGASESAKELFTTTGAKELFNSIRDLEESFGGLLGSATGLNLAFSGSFLEALSTATTDMKDFSSVKLTSISNSIKSMKNNLDKLSGTLDKIKGFAEDSDFVDMLSKIIEIVESNALSMLDNLYGTISDIWGLLTEPITNNEDAFVEVLENLTDLMNTILEPLGSFNDLLNQGDYEDSWVHYLFDALTNLASFGVGNVLDDINSALERDKAILDAFFNLWDGIKSKTIELVTNVLNSQFVKDVKANWESIKSKTVELKNRLEDSPAVALMKATWESIKSKTVDLWQKITDSKAVEGAKNIWDGIKTKTVELGAKFSTKFEDIKQDLKNLANCIIEFFNEHIIDTINKLFNITIPTNAVTEFLNIDGWGGQIIKLGHIPTFATGGIVEDGLFMANHNELVGKFSNGKTAVANNKQITDGIEEASYRGFMRALSESGNNGSSVRVVLEGDAKGLFNVVRTEADENHNMSGEEVFVY